jgi:hypothetical protein
MHGSLGTALTEFKAGKDADLLKQSISDGA